MTLNPYQLPASPVLAVTDADARRIGLRVGCAFAFPWLVLLLLESFGYDKSAESVLVNCLGLASMIPLSIGSGRWWGRSVETMSWPRILAVSLILALLWVLSLYGVLWTGYELAFHSKIGIASDALPIFLRIVGVAWIVSLTMGFTVLWRLRRANRLLAAAKAAERG